MPTRRMSCSWSLTAFVSCVIFGEVSAATAQDRPEEAEIFGAPADEPAPPSPSTPSDEDAGAASDPRAPAGQPSAVTAAADAEAPTTPSPNRDDAILGSPNAEPVLDPSAAPADPLSIGGQLFLRAQTRIFEDVDIGESTFNMPALLDVYFDARPNDRVRGYALGRMTYDPTVSGSRPQLSATEAASGSASLSDLVRRQPTGPRVQLDQLWLRFDVDHTVFVTAGKQHVRWGTGRIWSPSDFLHVQRRNPLEVFDARTGTTMLKLHVPIESEAWNFYAYGVAEGPDGVPTVEQLGAAARIELVFGLTELRFGAFAQKGQKPKFAADVSAGVFDFDVFLEVALRNREDVDHVRLDADAELPGLDPRQPWQSEADYQQAIARELAAVRYPVTKLTGYRPQVVAGLSYSLKYNDNDVFTLVAEYFYNPLGYDDSSVYPGLLAPRSAALRDPATYFYLGEHYAALVLAAPAPFSLDLHTFSLSTLANLSDRSLVTQLSYSLALLTHLRLEAYLAAHYGRPSGEFRLRVEFEGQRVLPATVLDAGVALRLAI